MVGPLDYTLGVDFVDFATTRWLETALHDASLATLSPQDVLSALRVERAEAEQSLASAGVAADDVRSFMDSVWLGPAVSAAAASTVTPVLLETPHTYTCLYTLYCGVTTVWRSHCHCTAARAWRPVGIPSSCCSR